MQKNVNRPPNSSRATYGRKRKTWAGKNGVTRENWRSRRLVASNLEKGSLKMLVQIAGLQQQASGWEGEENDEWESEGMAIYMQCSGQSSVGFVRPKTGWSLNEVQRMMPISNRNGGELFRLVRGRRRKVHSQQFQLPTEWYGVEAGYLSRYCGWWVSFIKMNW